MMHSQGYHLACVCGMTCAIGYTFSVEAFATEAQGRGYEIVEAYKKGDTEKAQTLLRREIR